MTTFNNTHSPDNQDIVDPLQLHKTSDKERDRRPCDFKNQSECSITSLGHVALSVDARSRQFIRSVV